MQNKKTWSVSLDCGPTVFSVTEGWELNWFWSRICFHYSYRSFQVFSNFYSRSHLNGNEETCFLVSWFKTPDPTASETNTWFYLTGLHCRAIGSITPQSHSESWWNHAVTVQLLSNSVQNNGDRLLHAHSWYQTFKLIEIVFF